MDPVRKDHVRQDSAVGPSQGGALSLMREHASRQRRVLSQRYAWAVLVGQRALMDSCGLGQVSFPTLSPIAAGWAGGGFPKEMVQPGSGPGRGAA